MSERIKEYKIVDACWEDPETGERLDVPFFRPSGRRISVDLSEVASVEEDKHYPQGTQYTLRKNKYATEIVTAPYAQVLADWKAYRDRVDGKPLFLPSKEALEGAGPLFATPPSPPAHVLDAGKVAPLPPGELLMKGYVADSDNDICTRLAMTGSIEVFWTRSATRSTPVAVVGRDSNAPKRVKIGDAYVGSDFEDDLSAGYPPSIGKTTTWSRTRRVEVWEVLEPAAPAAPAAPERSSDLTTDDRIRAFMVEKIVNGMAADPFQPENRGATPNITLFAAPPAAATTEDDGA